MKRPVNPYVAGAPLRGGIGFFGRRDTIEWVNRELRNPATNALVLFGQRRIGKTSLLLQLQRELPSDEFLPVYFDLQDQTRRALGAVLADLADTLAEGVGIAAPLPKGFDDQGHFFEREFLPQAYEALGNSRRLVFLFDEFDVMDQVAEAELPDTAAAKALRPFLRRLMTTDSRPAFVFVVGRRAEDLSVDFMATFKSSLVYEMWVLLPEHAEALVRQAEVNGSLRFTEGGVTRILSLTNDHPYLTQLLCQRIWERAYALNPEMPPVIDVQEVETSSIDALQAGEQALLWLWNGLSPAEKIYAAALAEVAEEGQTIPEDRIIQVLTANAARLRTREVELAPRDLVKRRVLEMAGEREYRFAVELFRRWVRLNKPVRDVKDELDRIEPVADRLYEIGRDFFNRRQWDNAVRFFRDALTAYPRHFRARLYLGETLMQQGNLDEALSELQQAYELDRDEARLPLARSLVVQAEAKEKAGDEENALIAAEKALEVSPNEQAARVLLATIWTRRGKAALDANKFEDALHAYDKAGNLTNFADDVLHVVGGLNEEEQMRVYDLILRSAPDHMETRQRRQAIWLRRGETALERNDLEAALAAFQQASDAEEIARVKALQERQVFATLLEEAEAHERAERWTEAAVAYEQLISQAPDEESNQEWQTALERCRVEEKLADLFLTGVGALSHKDWKQAQHAFAEVIRHHPGYRKNGKLAASLLEQAVLERKWALPKRSPLIITAVITVIILGLTIVATRALIDLRNYRNKLAEASFEIGNTRYQQGDMLQATSYYSRAIELNPKRAEYYIWSGIVDRETGQLGAALSDHNHAIELEPDNASHYLERARTYRAMGKLEAALSDNNQSVSLSNAEPGLYFDRAVTYQQSGKLSAALLDYNRAIELDPEEPYVYFVRGVFYRDFKHEPDQAVRDFEKFLTKADRSNCPKCEEAELYIKEQQALSLSIPNGSFETSGVWTYYDPENVQTFLHDSSQSYSGNRSLKITATGIDDHWVGNWIETGWMAGRTYWLSVYVKTTGSGKVCLDVAAKVGQEEEIGCAVAKGEWQIIRGTITLPNDAKHFLILLRTQFGTVYVDDVKAGQYTKEQ
jgi:tetratricopeptide (TPR) repeat protein